MMIIMMDVFFLCWNHDIMSEHRWMMGYYDILPSLAWCLRLALDCQELGVRDRSCAEDTGPNDSDKVVPPAAGLRLPSSYL